MLFADGKEVVSLVERVDHCDVIVVVRGTQDFLLVKKVPSNASG